jgi:hypothetical protein
MDSYKEFFFRALPLATDECELPMRRITKGRTATHVFGIHSWLSETYNGKCRLNCLVQGKWEYGELKKRKKKGRQSTHVNLKQLAKRRM